MSDSKLVIDEEKLRQIIEGSRIVTNIDGFIKGNCNFVSEVPSRCPECNRAFVTRRDCLFCDGVKLVRVFAEKVKQK